MRAKFTGIALDRFRIRAGQFESRTGGWREFSNPGTIFTGCIVGVRDEAPEMTG